VYSHLSQLKLIGRLPIKHISCCTCRQIAFPSCVSASAFQIAVFGLLIYIYPSTFGLWAKLRGSRFDSWQGKKSLYSQHPIGLWGPSSLLQIGYRATISPGGKTARA
jgi:hypothetical protein